MVNEYLTKIASDARNDLRNHKTPGRYLSWSKDTVGKTGILHNRWLIHFTDENGMRQILSNGFKNGVSNLRFRWTQDGNLTREENGLHFAFDLEHFCKHNTFFRDGEWERFATPYAVIFQSNGVLAHAEDEYAYDIFEVIFDSKQAHNFFGLETIVNNSDYITLNILDKNCRVISKLTCDYNSGYYESIQKKVFDWFINNNRQYSKIIYENKQMKEETTFYRFYSEVRSFIGKLLKQPTKAEPNKYLLDRGFTKERLIKLLRDEKILKRDEKILTPDKDQVKKVQYSVKYTLNSDTFEDKIEKIHEKYFGEKNKQINENIYKPRSVFKNEDKMKEQMLKNKEDREMYTKRGGMKMNECDCGGCMGASGGEGGGATGCSTAGDYQYTVPFGGVQRRDPMVGQKNVKGQKKLNDPAKFKMNKTIQAESKKFENKKNTTSKRIMFTEAQMDYILKQNGVEGGLDEATTTATAGSYQYTVPFGGVKKGDPSLVHNKPGGVCCDRIGKDGKIK